MVQLLHHYETQTNRIFLLLENVQGGLLVDHVLTLRQLHKKEASLASGAPHKMKKEEEGKREGMTLQLQQDDSEDSLARKLEALEVVRADPIGGESSDDDPEMDRMLEELMTIEPPSNRLGRRRRRGDGAAKHTPDPEEDSLTRRRRLLMQTVSDPQLVDSDQGNGVSEEEEKEEEEKGESQAGAVPQLSLHGDQEPPADDESTIINVIPPTPTTPQQHTTGPGAIPPASQHLPTSSEPPQKQAGISPPPPPNPVTISSHKNTSRGSSGQTTPQFSPALSQRNSPESSLLADDVTLQLEGAIKMWAAQMVIALEHLHAYGIVYQ